MTHSSLKKCSDKFAAGSPAVAVQGSSKIHCLNLIGSFGPDTYPIDSSAFVDFGCKEEAALFGKMAAGKWAVGKLVETAPEFKSLKKVGPVPSSSKASGS